MTGPSNFRAAGVARCSCLGAVLALGALAPAAPAAAQVPTPAQYFGFELGTAGELARYPKALEYFQLLARRTGRVRYEELGKTTLGNPFALVTLSSPRNLGRLKRLVEINHRLADPRGLAADEAARLAEEGRPFYFLYATIHSSEIGNGQAVINVAHRLATEESAEVREILDNVVVLLVPSQNPDGQALLIDHWYKTKGTGLDRAYPDLYHVYAGHDDNRHWWNFALQETRLNVLRVQNAYKPVLTHDMHQAGTGAPRIWVPPFAEPYDRNFHPILAQEQAAVGAALSTALVADGRAGVAWGDGYDLWAAARQYMVYHGQVRLLTEIASAEFANPYLSRDGRPLGPQEQGVRNPLPYSKTEWTLAQIVDYGLTAVFAGLRHVAKYRQSWLDNFYKVHRDWVNWKGAPYAFVLPARQRDASATLELLQILLTGEVEVQQARAPFTAGERRYEAGSYVVKLAQPYGAFAKTLLEKQVYPELRLFPGGPPRPPYDATAQTLGDLFGVEVDPVAREFAASLEPVRTASPLPTPAPDAARWAYLVGPESNAAFIAVARLQQAEVPVFRTGRETSASGRTFAPGTWVVPAGPDAARILANVSRETGLPVVAAEEPLDTAGFRLRPHTRIGLWRGVRNAPGGWLKWLFERYGFEHQVVSAADFTGELAARYDTIVLPGGIGRESIVKGLDTTRYGPEWAWAGGVGEAGWQKLAAWVRDGGTLVAVGDSVETARELLSLPIAKALPEARARRPADATAAEAARPEDVHRVLKELFSNPARLAETLRERVVEPEAQFYCPGSLLQNEFDVAHPVGYGLPARWPVFFESDQAYRLSPSFDIRPEVVARYPLQGPLLSSGWLLGEELLRGQANVLAFRVGRGYAVTLATQVAFRAQPRATFKLLFNAIFQGPSSSATADELRSLSVAGAATAARQSESR